MQIGAHRGLGAAWGRELVCIAVSREAYRYHCTPTICHPGRSPRADAKRAGDMLSSLDLAICAALLLGRDGAAAYSHDDGSLSH